MTLQARQTSKTTLQTMKAALLGNSLEDAFLWTKETLPYFGVLFFKNIVNATRRFPNSHVSLLRNVLHLSIATLQSIFIALAIHLSMVIQLLKLNFRITSLPIQRLASFFKNSPNTKYFLMTIIFAKNMALSFALCFLAYRHWAMLITFGFSAGLLIPLAIGPVLWVLQTSLKKVLHTDLSLTQNISPLLEIKDMAILFTGTFFARISAVNINNFVKEFGAIVEKYKQALTLPDFSQEQILAAAKRVHSVTKNTMRFIDNRFDTDLAARYESCALFCQQAMKKIQVAPVVTSRLNEMQAAPVRHQSPAMRKQPVAHLTRFKRNSNLPRTTKTNDQKTKKPLAKRHRQPHR